jgi:hypothetical protein
MFHGRHSAHPKQPYGYPHRPTSQSLGQCCQTRDSNFHGNFISALATVHRNCLLQLWGDFLPQVELTLNLLQFSRSDPTKSANEEDKGKFDYNKLPLAPLGTKGLLYNDPEICACLAPNGTNACCVGPALNHYWCL